MPFAGFRTRRFLLSAAAIEMLTGLSIYAAPGEFPEALYGPLIPWFPIMAAGLLSGAIALLLMVRYGLSDWLRKLVPVLPALPLAAFAFYLRHVGGLTGMVHYAGLAAALLLAPWLSTTETQQSPGGADLLMVALGAIQAGVGVVMLAVPASFNSVAFAPIRSFLPVLGVVSFSAAAALILPEFGVAVSPKLQWLRQGLGAAIPVVLALTFVRTSAWNGVAGWGIWALAVLLNGTVIVQRAAHTTLELGAVSGETDTWPTLLEHTLEPWTWLITLLVVALTMLGRGLAVQSVLRADLFVLLVTGYNIIAHWVLPHVGTPQNRLTYHLVFLALAIAMLLPDQGALHMAVPPLLMVIPLAEARSKGPRAGARILALVIGVVLLSGLDAWHSGIPITTDLANLLVVVVVLIAAGTAGVKVAGAQLLLVQELGSTHQALLGRNQELEVANLSLQAQSEELATQQGELAEQHAELIRQSDALQAQHDQLEASEHRFRMAFHDAPIGMMLIGPDHRVWQVNRALCSILGYAESELLGDGFDRVAHPEDETAEELYWEDIWAGKLPGFRIEKRYQHKAGRTVWAEMSVSAVPGPDGRPLQVITHVRDITEEKLTQEQLVHLADYDALTDLFNRRRFQEELERQMALARRYQSAGALFFLDLDQFKYVNDSLGHRAGDQLLKSLAELLKQRLRQTDLIARLGGDEFAVLLPEIDGPSAAKVADDLIRAIRDHVEMVNDYPVGITASIGIALFPEHGATSEELLARADLAMYQAKEEGRNGICMYEPGTSRMAQMESKLNWESRIREALEQDGFILHFQPMLALKESPSLTFEVLIRLPGEDGTLIYPDVFLGIAEQFGLINAIDHWVVEKSIQMIARANREGIDLNLSVNLSGRTLADSELPDFIQRKLAETGIDPESLILEVTETAAIADINLARKFVETLQHLGCRFALDDFGSAWSSLYYLKHLPVDFIKVDGSFIERLPQDPIDQELVKSMAEVARRLGKKVVAEFVQDEPTMALLKQYGVDYAQGYYISRPGPHSEMIAPKMR